MDTIIEKFRVQIFVYCLKELSDQYLAEEITQESFVRYYVSYFGKNLKDYETRSLLYKIAGNLITDYWRKERSYENYLSNFNKPHALLEDDIYNKLLLESISQACLSGEIFLTQLEKEVFELIFNKGFDPKSNIEMARESGLEGDKVKNAKKTLLNKIRNHFKSKN